jgi:hypothetical protein
LNAVVRHNGTNVPNAKNECNESIAVDSSRYTGNATTPSSDAMTNAIDTARSVVCSTRWTSGRAMKARRTNNPIAIITVRNTAQRAISNGGVVAVSERCGTRNCGAGPGLGPTAKVKAPCTG